MGDWIDIHSHIIPGVDDGCSLWLYNSFLLSQFKAIESATYVNNAINVEDLKSSLEKVEKTDYPFTVFMLGKICYQKKRLF